MTNTSEHEHFKKRNRRLYENVWNNIIAIEIENLSEKYGVCARNLNSLKEDIRRSYVRFNKHCSTHYMQNPDKPLDRHKVAACFVYAIIEAQPFGVPSNDVDDNAFFANERLALKVGYNVLASFLLEAIRDPETRFDDDENTDKDMRERAKQSVIHAAPFPEEVSHGDYLTNLAKALCFTQLEGNYNILLLSSILYHWELKMVPNDCHRAICKRYWLMSGDENASFTQNAETETTNVDHI